MNRLGFGIGLAAALSAFGFGSASASPVTVQIEVNPTSIFSYSTHTYAPFSDPGIVTLTFENSQPQVTDYGTTTISSYFGGTKFSSPYTALLPPDPYGGGAAAAYDYTFPNVTDVTSTFLEEFASQGNTFTFSSSDNAFSSYHIEIRIDRRTPSQGGTGTADYGFTPQDNLSFLQDALANPSAYSIEFNESAEVYSYAQSRDLYGLSISDYSARVISVVSASTSVPEPGTFLLTLSAILLLIPIASRSWSFNLFRKMLYTA